MSEKLDIVNEISKELIYIRRYVRDIPYSLIVAFYDTFKDKPIDEQKELQKRLYDMYNLSTDQSLLNLEISLKGYAEIIFKPESYMIDQSGKVMLFTKGGVALIGSVDLFGNTRRDIENVIGEWMYVEVSHGKPFIEIPNATIEYVEPLTPKVDRDRAIELLDRYGVTPFELFLISQGYKPTKEVKRLFLPRILSLFYYDGLPIHTFQLSQPETGKSHFAIRCEFAFNFTHFTEFPSPARLIFDGRLGTKGAVFTSNGIIIDEIDKLDKVNFKKAYQSLNTGLENGVWRRGVQTQHCIALEGYRFLPFILFGNVSNQLIDIYTQTNNNREAVTMLMQELTGMNVNSFVERFAITDIILNRIPITRYLIRNDRGIVGFLPDSVLRGLVEIVEDSIRYEYVEEDEECIGRLRRHAEAVYNVMKALTYEEPDVSVVRSVVTGKSDVISLIV